MIKKILFLLLILSLQASAVFATGTDQMEEENPLPVTAPVEEEEKQVVTVVNENTTTVTNKYFDLTLVKKSQSAFGKYVPYELRITPHLDSPKTQILWNSPSTLSITPRHREFLAMQTGQTYTVRANVKPLRHGTYDITVSVISWQYNTNYTNAASDTLTFDKSLVSQPVSAEYQIVNILKYLGILILFGILCFVVIKLSQKYSKRIKQWLTPPF